MGAYYEGRGEPAAQPATPEVERRLGVAGFSLGQQLDEGSNVRADDTSHLPPGYRLDLVDDPCVIVLVREDGTVVARFTHNVDPDEVRWAAAEDYGLRGKGGHD